MANCPVCETQLRKEEVRGDRHFFDCPRCGPYSLTGSAFAGLAAELHRVECGSAKLSHALNRMSKRVPWPMLSSQQLRNTLEGAVIPTPQEQLDNLVLWLGENQTSLGASVDITDDTAGAVGVVDEDSLEFIMLHAEEEGLITKTDGAKSSEDAKGVDFYSILRLTFPGWSYLDKLRTGQKLSRQAFMAMKFGDNELDAIYRDHFKAAVDATGFTLKRLDEGQLNRPGF